MSNDIKAMSDKALRRQEEAASKRLAEIAALEYPGRDLPLAEAQPLRDEIIRSARAAKAERQAARAELTRREAEKQSYFERMRSTLAANKRRKENTPTEAEAKRKEFHAGLKREQDAKNAAELQRRRELGLLYEPTGTGGGDGPAAIFSSSVVWEFTEMKIREEGLVGQVLNARDIIALWWVSNLIEEHGGEAATFAAGTAPHWPDQDGDINYRESDLNHLQRNDLIAIERQPGAGGSITYRYGKRSLALIKSYREHRKRDAA